MRTRLPFTALLLTMALLGLPTTPAGAQTTPTVIDVDAADGIGRSVTNSRLTFFEADGALLGTASVFADNLASGSLQGVGAGQPLLLTESDSLDPRVLAELQRLGVDTVTVLGGSAAISDDVVTTLEDEGFTVQRRAGATRVETAIAIAGDLTSDTVLIVRGFADGDETQAFADSLAAGAWAAVEGWPIVFTQTETLTGSTADHLADVGYTEALVIGGTGAISADTFGQIEDLVDSVTRVSGATRVDTAVAIAERRGFTTSAGAAATIVVDGQSAEAWTDGFTLAALAGRLDLPIVLGNSATDDLPDATSEFLVGGTDTTFAATAPAAFPGNVRAVCGSTLPDSGAADQCGDVQTEVGATARETFAGDAELFSVSVSPTSVVQGGSVTIAATGLDGATTFTYSGCGVSGTVNQSAATVGEDGRSSVTFTVPASQAVGSCSLFVELRDADGASLYNQPTTLTVTSPTVSGATGTARPELSSATIVQTVTTGTATRLAGTYVRYTFDSPVTSVNSVAGFTVYTADHVIYTADAAVREAGGTSVEARFDANGGPTLTTADNAAKLTLAAVAESSVADTSGLGNVDASAQIGTAQSTSSGGAGQTSAPDLTTVAGFRAAAGATQTVVDFTFDEVAYVTDSTTGDDFRLELLNGTTVTCTTPFNTTATGGGTVAGGSGETRVSVECPLTAGGLDVTAANTARGLVVADGVTANSAQEFSNCAGCTNGNPLQTAPVSNNGGTSKPDLVQVQFDPSSTAGVDIVGFTFDEPIQASSLVAGEGALFNVYDINGNEIPGTGGAVVPTVDGAIVSVRFADGTLASAVGGNVDAGVLLGTNSGAANSADEEAVGNVTTSITPGQTSGPQLTGVAFVQSAGFDPTAVTYTFDEVLTNDVDARFAVFIADGTKYTATACAINAAPAANTVTCTAFSKPAGGGAVSNAELRGGVVASAAAAAAQDSASAQNSAPGSRLL